MLVNPCVSIGVMSYNRPEKLKKVLRSIMNQSYENIEIIVSDNCSDGNAIKKIMEDIVQLDDRVVFFEQQKNMGMCYNFNFVLQQANGDYFMWAQDDDEYETKFVEKIIKKYNEYPETVFICSSYLRCYNNMEQRVTPDFEGGLFKRMYKFTKYGDDIAAYAIFRTEILKRGFLSRTQPLYWPNRNNYWRLGYPLIYGLLANGEYRFLDEVLFKKKFYDYDDFMKNKDPYYGKNKFVRFLCIVIMHMNIFIFSLVAMFIGRPRIDSIFLIPFPIVKELGALGVFTMHELRSIFRPVKYFFKN